MTSKLNLPFSEVSAFSVCNYDYRIVVCEEQIGIQTISPKKCPPFVIDFSAKGILYRLKQASLRKELIARTIGRKPNTRPHVIDATAGLGQDSLVLAFLGFEVTMIERSPILHLLLENALDRAKKHPQLAAAAAKLRLIQADAKHYLPQLPLDQRPDIIYLDPMFPARPKTALVKKEMVLLQNLIGKDPDSNDLLIAARNCALERVVVKRPKFATNIGEKTANFSLNSKKNRFDIYLSETL